MYTRPPTHRGKTPPFAGLVCLCNQRATCAKTLIYCHVFANPPEPPATRLFLKTLLFLASVSSDQHLKQNRTEQSSPRRGGERGRCRAVGPGTGSLCLLEVPLSRWSGRLKHCHLLDENGYLPASILKQAADHKNWHDACSQVTAGGKGKNPAAKLGRAKGSAETHENSPK